MNDIQRQVRRALLGCLTLGLFVCAAGSAPAAAQSKRKGGKAAAATRAGETAAHYTCPMHPEVRSKKKGNCPKCKMDLRAVSAEEAAAEAGKPSHDSGEHPPGAARAEAASGQASKMNIPDVEVLDQDGKKLHFYSDLVKGKTVVVNFIFTTCTTICPPLGATFARVQKDLAGRDVHLISISVDPATDTPERMKAWGAKFHAGPGWTFVTGAKPQIDELLRALAASSSRREDHSPALLIGNDARGAWTRAYGLARPSQILQLIDNMLEARAASTTTESPE